MPIVDVEIIGEPPAEVRQGLARRLADSLSTALGARRTMVKLHVLDEGGYSESGAGPAAGSRPVFVYLRLEEQPEGDMLQTQAQAIARAVSGACRRPPTSVHVVYDGVVRGRVALGGKVA